MAIVKRYPQGFESLCLTQTFYNFSFYGLKSIFLLYIITRYSITESEAIILFATFMSLSYVTSLIGGWVADNKLGPKKTIILGGLFQAFGIFLLMFSSAEVVFLALSFISLGSGFFKPNLSTSIGMLFEDPRDPQKDKAYSTFYTVMNFGSFIGPLLCGFVSETYGGYYNSLLLIIVTLIGGIFLFSQRIDLKQEKEKNAPRSALPSHSGFLGLCFIALIGVLYLLFKYHQSFSHLMGIIAVGSLLYLGKIFYGSNSQEKRDILSVVLYTLLFTLFCALFEQAGSSLMLFFEKAVDRNLFGIEIPTATVLSLGPVFVLICSPLLILLSAKVLEKNKSMDGLVKIAIGFIVTGLSFVILALGCYISDALLSPLWIIGSLFIQTFGELLIVPIGYSNISKLAPPRFRSVMMSFWLMAIAYGHYIGGFIAQLSVSNSSKVETSLDHYQSFFWNLALMPCLLGILVLFFYYGLRSKNAFRVETKIQKLT